MQAEKLFAINIYFSGWDMFNSTFAKLYLIFYGLLILVYLSALCVSLFLIPAFSTFWKIPRGKTIRHKHVCMQIRKISAPDYSLDDGI